MSESDLGIKRSLRQRPLKQKELKKQSEKLNQTLISDDLNKRVNEIYLQDHSKVAEFHPTGLETIYEAPKGKNATVCMGVIKLKRHCRFTPFYNPSKYKIKLRKNKSKNLKRVGVKVPTGLNITQEQVEKALRDISSDENEEILENQENIEKKTWIEDFSELNCQIDNLSTSLNTFKVEHDAKKFLGDDQYEKLETKNIDKDKLSYENLDLFSLKYSVNKTKRDRRRSGRIEPPLNLSNQLHLLTPLHINTKDNNDFLGETDARTKSELLTMQADVNYTKDIPSQDVRDEVPLFSIDLEDTIKMPQDSRDAHSYDPLIGSAKTQNQNFSNVFLENKEVAKNKRKTRKVSGIHRSIYKTHTNTPSPQKSLSPSQEQFLSPAKSACLSQIKSSSKLLSPTLFEQLNINSPEPKTNKVRRKSARLSWDEPHSHLGSVWIPSKSPNEKLLERTLQMNRKEDINQIIPEGNPVKIFHDSLSNETKMAEMQILEPATSTAFANLDNQGKAENSPVISGIFDCSARIHKDKGLIMKKGCKIKLNHFNIKS